MATITFEVSDDLHRQLCLISLFMTKDLKQDERICRPESEAALPYFETNPSPTMQLAVDLLIGKVREALGEKADRFLGQDPRALRMIVDDDSELSQDLRQAHIGPWPDDRA